MIDRVQYMCILLKNKCFVLPLMISPSVLKNALLQRQIIPFPFDSLSCGRLWEVKNKGKFQAFSSKSGRGRLREVVAYERFQL